MRTILIILVLTATPVIQVRAENEKIRTDNSISDDVFKEAIRIEEVLASQLPVKFKEK